MLLKLHFVFERSVQDTHDKPTTDGVYHFMFVSIIYTYYNTGKPFYVNDLNEKLPPRFFFKPGKRKTLFGLYAHCTHTNTLLLLILFNVIIQCIILYLPTLKSKYNIKIKVTAYLKPPHVPGIASVFQTILIAFQEKLQEKSIKQKMCHFELVVLNLQLVQAKTETNVSNIIVIMSTQTKYNIVVSVFVDLGKDKTSKTIFFDTFSSPNCGRSS